MNKYLTNTIIKHKNEYIDKIFYIEKGYILEEKTNKIFQEHSYIFLEYIYQKEYTNSNYITKTMVVGKWIDFDNIDISLIKYLSIEINKLSKHNELLLINDLLTRITRYLYYEYLNNKNYSFYIPSIKELSNYLSIKNKEISHLLNYLINKSIISKHNRLINILNIKKLEENAFS